MAAALECFYQHSDSPVYPSLENNQDLFSGFTGPRLGPTPTLVSPFETPDGSDMTDVDTRSEGSVYGNMKIEGRENVVEETSGNHSTASRSFHRSATSDNVDTGSSADASQVTGAQDKSLGVNAVTSNHNVNKGAIGGAIVTTLLLNSEETLDSSRSYVKEPVNGSIESRSLDDCEPTEPSYDSVPGIDSQFNNQNEVLASGESVEFKDVAKKQDPMVEEDSAGEDAVVRTSLQTTTSLLGKTPRSGEFYGDMDGHHQNARHAYESRTTLEPSAETMTPSQGIHASKYSPTAPQHNRMPHAGPFVQRFEHLPRAPRRMQFGNQPQHDRTDPRDDPRMVQAQLRKVEQTLDDERKAHKVELDRTEGRARDRYEKALQQITSEILGQRAALIQQTVHLKEYELSLNTREALNRKIEHLLAVGQKQSAGAEADAQDLDTFINVNEEIVREKVIYEIRRHDRQVDAQLAIKREKLNHREATIDMREKAYSTMYKTQVADKLQLDIRAELEQAILARESSEYERGLAKGKALGHAEGNEELRQLWYDKGFAACHNMIDRMKRFQAGLLAHDSPELSFLFDQSHPDNPFLRGLQIGRRDVAASLKPSSALDGAADQTTRVQPGAGFPASARDSQPPGLAARHDYTTANGNADDMPELSHPYAHLSGRTNSQEIGLENGVSDARSAPEHYGGPDRGLPNVFGMSSKSDPHAFAYTNGNDNIGTNGHTNGANGCRPPPNALQNGVDLYSTPASRADLSPQADPSFGVPMYGPRRAPRLLYPSLYSQPPQTPTTNGAVTNVTAPTGDCGTSSAGRPHVNVPTFLSGKRLLTYGRVEGEDERVHKADTQVDLIDLY
ncbi:uncharacterized protein CC84DRAFT_433632 [Paraphaeosphaeria sporulosa]|uniref:Uncharacterized protein n=1 Tax=Paraphaeosphaeria sporulosa TaxID=1460663 RepID=A0A177CP55_9PLEO|nr:uncharacterized protein CC84DRAFT_433632 [Paraphaeosphaeria sporulosa]OAG09303.1 hypothetical protein CC84DRAFT_433632 [Paraphaeosphaeria sporulosa]